MRRAAVVAVVLAAVAAVAVVTAIDRRGDEGGKAAATVGGHKITREQLELTIEHFREEAEREGRAFPEEGTAAYKLARKQALGLLVDQAELEIGAGRLGIRVTEDEIDARLAAAGGGGEAEEGASVRVKAEAAFTRAAAKEQLLTEAVFAKVTAAVRVSAAEVRAYYRAHRRLYAGVSFASVAAAIRSELLATRRNAAMSRWREKLRRDLAPSVHYEKLD